MNTRIQTSLHKIRAIALMLVLGMLCLAANALAAPMLFSGADIGNSLTPNADAAFGNWQTAVANNFVLDDFDSPTGTAGFGGSLTTSLGNTFSSSDDLVGNSTFGVGVLNGSNLQLTKQGPVVDFVWDIASPVDAFGFFARNNSGGIVTIDFNDGTAQSFNVQALNAGSGDNLFWGITDLAGVVNSVSITSTDPANNSNWDRFVYREVKADVPEPGTIGLIVAGLSGLIALRKSGNATTK